MIDRERRRIGHRALTRFVEGVTTNDEFESEYPDAGKSGDRALRAVETMVWHFYADHKVHALAGPYKPDSAGELLLRRCLLFLDLDLEYAWPADNFIATPASEVDGLRASGALAYWPFASASELEAAGFQ